VEHLLNISKIVDKAEKERYNYCMTKRKKRKASWREGKASFLSPAAKRSIAVIILFAIALISLLAIFDLAGKLGPVIDKILHILLGHFGFWTFPIILATIGYMLVVKPRVDEEIEEEVEGETKIGILRWVGLFLLVVSYSGLFHLSVEVSEAWSLIGDGEGGGIIGFVISYPLQQIMSFWPTLIVLVALLLISVVMLANISLHDLFGVLKGKGVLSKLNFFTKREEGEDEEYKEDGFISKELIDEIESVDASDYANVLPEKEAVVDEEDDDKVGDEEMPIIPKRKRPKIDIPLELLSNKSGKPTAGDIKSNQEIIRSTLSNFGIEVEMGDVSIGPTVTQYTFRPAQGVKISQITTLSNDLALALAAHPIRIEAPIPGKSLVGVEVPNQKIALVTLREVLESPEFKNRKHNMTMVLGKDVAGKACVADLTKMPHVLVAGATNSGKTVCLNTLIVSLLYQNQPDDLRLILVDPKRVEMPCYNEIPHLLTPVITDVKQTVNALKWTIGEMDRRFHVLSNAGKRNIQSFNMAKPKDKLPYLVIIVDELADLMAVASVEVEATIIRLAQMARAVGIHLILATQRPSVDIITGLIKANVPGRIAFSVASLVDSRTILDAPGAEKLLGRGDMLFSSAELSKPKRVQGAYVSDKEIEDVVEFLRGNSTPDYVAEVVEKIAPGHGVPGLNTGEEVDDDELLPEAREMVIKAEKASASYLQRRLRVGYARAARLLDLLEEQGIIGPAEGSKPREVLVKSGKELPEKVRRPEYESVDTHDYAITASLGKKAMADDEEVNCEDDEEENEEEWEESKK